MEKLSFMVTKEGKLPDGIRQTLQQTIPKLAGKHVWLSLQEAKKTRSEAQNDYWFGILDKYVIPRFREAGSNWSSYKLHCALMLKLGYEDAMVDPNGEVISIRKESHKFTTREWEEFMERARAYIATEYRIYLPLPNEKMDG